MRKERLSDRLKVAAQYVLPHHALSRAVYWLARRESLPAVRHAFMRWFIQRYGVDLDEAVEPDYRRYPHFNAFFTRALRPDARAVAPGDDVIVSPVDGMVSQADVTTGGRIIQAKGRHFSVIELLGGDERRAEPFLEGGFATLYLAPRDYHRIHMPFAGTLREMVHIPGRLFSVNPPATRMVPRLFARNERVAALFDTAAGPMAIVMVGALFVSSIETVWAGEVTPPAGWSVRRWRYDGEGRMPPTFAKGSEIGRFNMGSTVILLFAKEATRWDGWLTAGRAVRMGQRIGEVLRRSG